MYTCQNVQQRRDTLLSTCGRVKNVFPYGGGQRTFFTCYAKSLFAFSFSTVILNASSFYFLFVCFFFYLFIYIPPAYVAVHAVKQCMYVLQCSGVRCHSSTHVKLHPSYLMFNVHTHYMSLGFLSRHESIVVPSVTNSPVLDSTGFSCVNGDLMWMKKKRNG